MDYTILSALITAIPATVLAAASLFVSLYTHFIDSKEKSEPRVALEKITFDPCSMDVYAPANAGWKESMQLTPDIRDNIIKKTADSVCKEFIDDKEYMIINLIPKNNHDWNNAVILANVLQVEIKNHRDYISGLEIVKAYSQIPGRGEPLYESYYNVSLLPNNQQEIQINIAYIFQPGQGASINIDSIKERYNNRETNKETIILDIENNKDLHKVSSIIAFYDSSYLVKCRGLRRDYFGTVRMQVVSSFDGNNRVLSVNGISDRYAKKSFKNFYDKVKRENRR